MPAQNDVVLAVKNLVYRNKALCLILLTALFLRLAFFAAVRPWQNNFINEKIIMVDAGPYQAVAESILRDRSFAEAGTYRTPGYPIFLAAVYSVFGNRPWAAILLQALIGTLTVFLVYIWARQWFDSRTGLLAASIYALEPHVLVYGTCLLTETLFVFLVLSAACLWYSGLKNGKAGRVAAAALLLGYAALVRPIAILLPAVLVFASIFFKGASRGFKVRSALLLCVVFMLPLSSWMFKNYSQYGHFSLTHINGFNLLYVSAAYTEVAKTGKSYSEVCREFDEAARAKSAFATNDLFEQSGIFARIGIAYIRANPGFYLRRHLTGMATLFTNLASTDTMDLVGLKSMQKKYNVYEFHNYFDMVSWYFKNKTSDEIVFGLCVSAFLITTYVLWMIGAWAALRQGLFFCLIINFSVAGYFCMMTGVFGVARYRLPLVPFYVLFSAAGLVTVIKRLNRRPSGSGV